MPQKVSLLVKDHYQLFMCIVIYVYYLSSMYIISQWARESLIADLHSNFVVALTGGEPFVEKFLAYLF